MTTTLFVSLMGATFSLCQRAPEIIERPDEHRFKKIVLTEETMDPTALAVAYDGKVYFTEDIGTIKVYRPGSSSVSIVGELKVFSCGEEGLIGMVLDPDFENNGWMYVNRTVSNYMDMPCGEVYKNPEIRFEDPTSNQTISRFTIVNDILDMASEKVLLKIPNQHMRHIGGSLAFDGAGNLYISIGENTHPGFLNPYAPLDERPGRKNYDTQRTSANTMDYRGKILRIHPEKNGTYTIPDGNLFAKDDPLALPEIYVMGCRNPFRISVDKKTNTLYWGEVGPDAYADIPRGPMGYDEINATTEGGFFGWPYFIANNQAYARYDYEAEEAGVAFDANRPENSSPNNSGKKILPPATPAFIWYPYAASEEFPELGQGGRTAMAGPVYHYESEKDSNIKFPSYFDKSLFIYDWMRGWIKVVSIGDNGELIKIEDFMPSTRFISPIDMQFGPDGSLYIMEFGTTWGANPDARLIKIEYILGNRPPHIEIRADKTVGSCPLTVNFNSDDTRDYDKDDSLKYEWRFNSNDIQSSERNPTFIFEDPGVYTATLTVKDNEGATSTSQLQIKAGNDTPKLTIDMPTRGSFYWENDKIPYTVRLKDKEDGNMENGDIDPEKVHVSLEWMKGNYTMESSSNGMGELKSQGEKLIGESDCRSCHKVNERAIGPSFLEVAKRYKADKNATNYIAEKIISGGSGVWGDISMSAHPLFSEADAQRMADYILSLATENKNLKKMDVNGTITIPPTDSEEDRTFVLKASYSDEGASGMEPITVSAMRMLQPPKLQAENFSTQRDALSEVGDNGVSMGFSSTYISFKNIDLTAVDSVTFKYSYNGPECFITIKTDSPDGEVIGKARFSNTLKTKNKNELRISIKETSGSKEIFFLHDKAPDIHAEIYLDWISFHKGSN
ncbi:MAG TPA: PQQ-dependent sugar dehydrogenase [Arenibacter sp.]|nr:PQQ-dependent sugar dehydrogenase [Arenibacter sp.]